MEPTEQSHTAPDDYHPRITPYIYPGIHPTVPPPTPVVLEQMGGRLWLMAGASAAILLFIAIFLLVTHGSTTHTGHTAGYVPPKATKTVPVFAATVTPQADATATPTVGPGTPTQTPIIVYITAVPGRPTPLPTPRPNATQTPYPTYTPFPLPTATATPRPMSTLNDPDGNNATPNGGGGFVQGPMTSQNLQAIQRSSVFVAGSLTWNLPNIVTAKITAYYCYTSGACNASGGSGVANSDDLPLLCSGDGASYGACTMTSRVATNIDGNWRQVVWTISAPPGTNYFQIGFPDVSSGTYGPGIGLVSITYQP